MGLLKKLLGGADKVYDAKVTFEAGPSGIVASTRRRLSPLPETGTRP